MKQNILFKTLVDILFFIQCFGIIGIIVILPSNISTVSQVGIPVVNWSFIHWIVFILSSISCTLFLIAIYYLRSMARHQITNKKFNYTISTNLKKSGKYFISYGLLSIIIICIQFIQQLTNNRVSFTYDLNVQLSFFAIIIGLFFIIQSHTIKTAKHLKDENELTI